MKNLKYSFFIAGLLLFCLPNKAQIVKTKLDIPLGIAYPEFVNLGLRYQYADICQAGIYFGGDMGIKPAIIHTLTLDNMVHFGQVSYLSNRPVWYARQGFTYSTHTEAGSVRKFSYLNLGLGHDFPLNDLVGINFDMGVRLQVREKYMPAGGITRYKTNFVWGYLFRLQLYVSL